MTAPVCYLARCDRGGRMVGLRVMDRHDQATWHCPVDQTPAVESDARAAAEWLADRLSRNGKAISRLIVDVDGGVCSWVTTNDTSDQVLRALIEPRFDEGESTQASRFPGLQGETALQPLHERESVRRPTKKSQSEPQRTPVAALPVVPARLLIDHLDRLGIRVHTVEALWQAIAQAWDPSMSVGLGGENAQRVIAETQPIVAVVVLDPAGRLVWSWSHAGTWLAGGSLRLQTRKPDELPTDSGQATSAQRPLVTTADIGRLGADWLAWSVQIGCLPARTIIVGDPAVDPAGLNAQGIAQALLRTIPDAAIDFVRESDPLGATLSKLADRETAQLPGIEELTNRPGRSHRAMYVWSTAALLGAAALLAVGAWKIWSMASDRSQEARNIEGQYLALVKDTNLPLRTALIDLELQLSKLKQSRVDLSSVIQPPRPVLQELEALSFVLASNEITLRELSVTSVSVSIKADVADTRTFEELSQAIRSVAGSSITDWRTNLVQRGARVECTFTGTWPPREGGT